ncbi:MAG: hypothetical protein P8J81_00225 [Luminiphilus sp.]|nr:hypothetical protein [Luminiphilus sp.]MDG2134667.1 hypothetical protein [Luminiphilus sp.]
MTDTFISWVLGKASTAFVCVVSISLAVDSLAQGQDTTPWIRDLQVIEVMLPGLYSNANQAYFDGRRQVSSPQPRHDLLIEAADDGFIATLSAPGGAVLAVQRWSLVEDDEQQAVRMNISSSDGEARCPVWWKRDVAQFSAMSDPECVNQAKSPAALLLAQQQFWWTPQGDGGVVKLHRARQFSCFADIPGVGGGRDEPYVRYDNLDLHDQGAETWFTTNDGRHLGLRLFNVDWPINNYDGYFTRDSLVIYVVEKLDDGSTKEHGYAFTLPEANRIGINLKWLLASCFMISGKVDTPTM